MIDAQAVELAEHLLQPLAQESERRARAAARVGEVAAGVEDRIVPGLALGIGAAGGCAHGVAGEQEGLGKPGVAAGEAYLEIAKEIEPELLGVATQFLMLPVEQELGKGVSGDGLVMLGKEGTSPGRAATALLRGRPPEPPVEQGLGGALPMPPVAPAMVMTKGLVEAVAHQPAAVSLPEEVKLPGHGCQLPTVNPCQVTPPHLFQDTLPRVAGIFMDRMGLAGRRTPCNQLGQGLFAQQFAPGLGGERQRRQRQTIARKDGAVVRRGVGGRGHALGTQLQAVEAQRSDKGEELPRAHGIGRAPADILLRAAGEGRVVDAEQQPADAEHL